MGGWTIVGTAPVAPKYVLIAAPHTSNWDFVWTMAIAVALGVRLSWMAKDSLFPPGLGWLLRRLGGIPVDRSRSNDLVATCVERFAASDRLILLVPVEGSRSYRSYWKSGFYHIARAAQVPVVLGHLNFRDRTGGFGATIELTGDIRGDMDVIRRHYANAVGRRPQLASPVRLREEDPNC